MVSQDSKVNYFASSLFLLIIIKSGLLAGIRWSVCMLKSHRDLCVAFSRTGAWLCIYHLLVCSILNFLSISQWITLPIQSCLILFSLCANLLHLLIIWLVVSSLSPHSLHLLFCRVLFILTLIWFVLMALSYAGYYYYYYYYYYLRVFHINVSWWSFTGDCVTTSLLKSTRSFCYLA